MRQRLQVESGSDELLPGVGRARPREEGDRLLEVERLVVVHPGDPQMTSDDALGIERLRRGRRDRACEDGSAADVEAAVAEIVRMAGEWDAGSP